MLEYLKAQVGEIVRRDQIDYIANSRKEATRRLRELRDTDPGGLAIIDFLDENSPDDREYLLRALESGRNDRQRRDAAHVAGGASRPAGVAHLP